MSMLKPLTLLSLCLGWVLHLSCAFRQPPLLVHTSTRMSSTTKCDNRGRKEKTIISLNSDGGYPEDGNAMSEEEWDQHMRILERQLQMIKNNDSLLEAARRGNQRAGTEGGVVPPVEGAPGDMADCGLVSKVLGEIARRDAGGRLPLHRGLPPPRRGEEAAAAGGAAGGVRYRRPSRLLPPHAVIEHVFRSLQNHDYPHGGAGLEQAFLFSYFECPDDGEEEAEDSDWRAHWGDDSHVTRPAFEAMLREQYSYLFGCRGFRMYGRPQFAIDDVCAIFQVEVDPGEERGGATALGPLPPPRGPCRVAVLLSRPPRGSHKDCWLINAVYDEECHLPAGEGLSGAPPPAA